MRRHQVAAVVSVLALFAALMSPAQAGGGGSTGGDGSPDGGGSTGSGVDLALSVTGPSESPVRGATFPVSLEVANIGSEAATDVSVATYVSDALELGTYVTSNPAMTCELGEYDNLDCSLPSLGSGESASATLTLTRVKARETWLDAWTAASTEEDNYENNYGGIFLEPDRTNPADVEVSVSAPEQPEPGAEFDYTAVVTNRGPELAREVTFNQSVSDGASHVSVSSSDPDDECSLFEETYDEAGVEGGPYTYREVRCTLGNMQFAEQATIIVTVVRNDPHELWSSAWVGTSSYDENYENDWADSSTAGHPSVTSDLAMTLSGPEGLPLVGDDFTYTLTVTNLGPAPATDVVGDMWLPQELALRGLTPSRGTDVCEQGDYQGITCTFGNLAVGETATVAIDVTRVRAREFWMGGSIWSSNYDPVYENNYLELQTGPDTSVAADIGVKLDGPKDPAVGENFDYTATVTNHGPDTATAVSLVGSVPDGTEFVSATSPDDSDTCTLFEETYDGEGTKTAEGGFVEYTYQEVRCDLGTLVPSETATITVTVNRTTEYELWESAWVETASYDENYDNDYDSLGSFGEAYKGCGAPIDENGDVIVCDVAGGTDAERTYVASGKSGRRVMKSGKGNDTITVRVPTHSKKHRRIVVNAGRGRDVIRLLVAPGAGNVTVILKGGAGRDSIEVVAPKPGKRFKLRMFGGSGNDSCASAMGDRHRSRAC